MQFYFRKRLFLHPNFLLLYMRDHTLVPIEAGGFGLERWLELEADPMVECLGLARLATEMSCTLCLCCASAMGSDYYY